MKVEHQTKVNHTDSIVTLKNKNKIDTILFAGSMVMDSGHICTYDYFRWKSKYHYKSLIIKKKIII